MHRAFFPTLICLLAINASIGQNSRLIGLITYQNTGEPVGGVAITPTEGANPTKSNDTGQFELDFSGKTPGDMVKMILTKDQYRVVGVDPMIVEVALRQEADDLLRIVMVKKSEYAQREDKYVKAIEKQLAEKDEEIQFYRSQLTKNELTDAERRGLTQQIGTLTEEVERLEKNKKELAKRLAQVDLDQASSFAREALEAFESGELDQALTLMEDEKMDQFWDNVLKQEEEVRRAKKQGVENYMIKARLLSADGQFEGAYQNFLKAIKRDSTNVDNLWELAYFCGELNQQKRAIRFYRQALRHTQAESDKATLLNNLGNQLGYNDQYEQAEAAFNAALEIGKRLAKDNPERFEPDLATTQNNLGWMYADLNAYEKAESAYLEALEIRKRLAVANPERYEPDVATTQNNLGNMYADLNAYEKAESAYLEALEIRKRFAVANPERYEPDVAMTQNNLGNMYRNLNAYEKAESAYLEALEIFQRLAKDNPQRFEPYVATTQNNLGLMYADLNAYEKAESAYLEALEIYQRLAVANPERYEPDVAMTQNNLGAMYYNLNAYEKAESAYLEALEIRKRLAVANPERYEPDVANTQNNLGLMYADLNAYEKAESAYLEALEIRKRLAVANPERYEPDVATTQSNLGLMYFSLGKAEKAMAFLELSLPIYQKLAAKAPRAYDLQVARTLMIKGLILIGQEEQVAANEALLEAKSIAEQYPNAPFSATVLQYYKQYYKEVNIPYQQAIDKGRPLQQRMDSLASEAEKAPLQQQIVSVFAEAAADHPENQAILSYLSFAYGNLAWYKLFAKDFTAAEQSARRGLETAPSQQWINTNLALSLLYQGKYEEAEAVYVRFKDQPFNEEMDFRTAFLQDLEDLEAAGITHPDVEKVRALLGE